MTNYSDMEQLFRPIDGFRSGHRYNLDGFVAIGTQYRQGEGYAGYCQVFFSGAVEAVCSEILTEAKECGRRKDGRFIASIEYERDLITAVSAYLKAFHALGIGPPVSISLSLLGCRGAFMYAGDRIMDRLASRGRLHAIDRDVAHLPDVFIENLDVDIQQTMKPVFDAVWNACGFPYSLNYDKDGKWDPKVAG